MNWRWSVKLFTRLKISLNVSAAHFLCIFFNDFLLPRWSDERLNLNLKLKLKKVAQLQRQKGKKKNGGKRRIAYTFHMHEPSAMNQSLLKSTNYGDADADVDINVNVDVEATSLGIGRRSLHKKRVEKNHIKELANLIIYPMKRYFHNYCVHKAILMKFSEY